MRQEVIVLPVGEGEAMEGAAARRWLDEQFVVNDCEPLRATGKVLTADKVLAIAGTVGRVRFDDDPAWAASYARATLGALGRATAQVEVDAGSVTF